MTRVILADGSHREEWDGYVSGHPEAAPYHRWAWLTAVERAYGFAPAPLLALRGECVAGVLPLVRLKQPGRPAWLISLPYCDFCGPLADDERAAQMLLEQAVETARGTGAAGVEIRRPAPGDSRTPKVIMRLELPQGSGRLLASFPAKLRSQVNKPRRDGLTAVRGGEELLDAFYHVFARNMRDLGSPTHSLGWFREVVRGYGDRAQVTVVSTREGLPGAAGLMLVEGGWAFVPWASSLREHNRQNPNMLLYWTMLAGAADAGLTGFDFGRSTPGQGTYNFKKQWGAREQGLAWTRRHAARGADRPGPAAAGGKSLRPLAEACWRRLPLGVANWAGPKLRRYISL